MFLCLCLIPRLAPLEILTSVDNTCLRPVCGVGRYGVLRIHKGALTGHHIVLDATFSWYCQLQLCGRECVPSPALSIAAAPVRYSIGRSIGLPYRIKQWITSFSSMQIPAKARSTIGECLDAWTSAAVQGKRTHGSARLSKSSSPERVRNYSDRVHCTSRLIPLRVLLNVLAWTFETGCFSGLRYASIAGLTKMLQLKLCILVRVRACSIQLVLLNVLS